MIEMMGIGHLCSLREACPLACTYNPYCEFLSQFRFDGIQRNQQLQLSITLCTIMHPKSLVSKNMMLPDAYLEAEQFEVKRAPLGDDFVPNNYCVLCGRGKDYYNAVGNRRFRVIVNMSLERYSKAESKSGKSQIVSEVIDVVRQSGGAFIKHQYGIWWEIGDRMARYVKRMTCYRRSESSYFLVSEFLFLTSTVKRWEPCSVISFMTSIVPRAKRKRLAVRARTDNRP